ncbi:UDP-N-acetyl glucosamine 2-epimerase [Sphingomonas metalli]|uniref:UDP-N-acetylglucosamine 2-epimerase (non-hydrolyzing) n=1 Tax=Sphingomonas metalli TaxID=1779358 RepID=A0A916SVV6_9SPHN|nr:UDP-N-acetylglucosamine 2-epimerase (non-hydrolyzing) [Sphingomonas metalli]GGB16035.1 UDP-N-acetyl glucosamine 2-epimerase [Sphingomonas metalli]
MTKILVVIGTRPEAIKMAPVVHALREHATVTAVILATGQHGAIVDRLLDLFGIPPDRRLPPPPPGQTLDRLVAWLLTGIGAQLDAVRPDLVLVQGDTASALAGATAAYHRAISVGHVEAGLRSGNARHPLPEEGYRRAIAGYCDLHFAPTEQARRNLDREQVHGRIYLTGNTVVDALGWMRERMGDAPAGGDGRRLILATLHRRENWPHLPRIARAIGRLADRGDVRVMLPMQPNPAVREPLLAVLGGVPAVSLTEPLDYPDLVRALSACHFVITDSGGLQEEAPALGKPVLVLRDATERPEGVAAGVARLIGTDEERIVREGVALLDDMAAHAAMARPCSPYGDGLAGRRIADIIADVAGAGGVKDYWIRHRHDAAQIAEGQPPP